MKNQTNIKPDKKIANVRIQKNGKVRNLDLVYAETDKEFRLMDTEKNIITMSAPTEPIMMVGIESLRKQYNLNVQVERV